MYDILVYPRNMDRIGRTLLYSCDQSAMVGKERYLAEFLTEVREICLARCQVADGKFYIYLIIIDNTIPERVREINQIVEAVADGELNHVNQQTINSKAGRRRQRKSDQR